MRWRLRIKKDQYPTPVSVGLVFLPGSLGRLLQRVYEAAQLV